MIPDIAIPEPRHYIGGMFRRSADARQLDVIDPASERVVGKVPAGAPADVGDAVAAARRAFAEWSEVPLAERVRRVTTVGHELRARRAEIAAVIAVELGMPLSQCDAIQLGLPIGTFEHMDEYARRVEWSVGSVGSTLVREPIGVVATITPWNYPLHQIALKVAPALVAGCTVVIKPSELTPLSVHLLAEIIHGVGFPAGTVNVVYGTGPEVGEPLCAHEDVDMVSFTGSTAVGAHVSAVAAKTIKRVALELGGKSANVLLDDADVEAALQHGVRHACRNSGQTCTALSRMLVPRALLGRVEALAAEIAREIRIGRPFEESAEMGPLISDRQRERVLGLVRRGMAEGARVIAGGAERPSGLDPGFFVVPTVFSDADARMTIGQEEIFGPVLTVIPYTTDRQALELANATRYGLWGRVWSRDPDRAFAFARGMRAGQVIVNDAPFDDSAPFGGYRQSGNGREGGHWGIEACVELKAIKR